MAAASTMATGFRPGAFVRLADVPLVGIDCFRQIVIDAVADGSRIAALFGRPINETVRLYAVLAADEAGTWNIASTDIGDAYPSLTPDCPQAHWFEREI